MTGIRHTISLERGAEREATFQVRLADTKEYLILDKDPDGKLDTDRKLGF